MKVRYVLCDKKLHGYVLQAHMCLLTALDGARVKHPKLRSYPAVLGLRTVLQRLSSNT